MPPHLLTPAQLELQASRRAAKLSLARHAESSSTTQADLIKDQRRSFLRRDWIPTPNAGAITGARAVGGSKSVRIVTWNVCDRSIGFCDSDLIFWEVDVGADSCSYVSYFHWCRREACGGTDTSNRERAVPRFGLSQMV